MYPLATPQLRPVRADDLQPMRRFVQALSPQSRRLRFHGGVKPDGEHMLRHLTQAEGRRHMAWVAVLPCDDGESIVGEARCVCGTEASAEFAIAVADSWQGSGLAGALMQALLRDAAAAGIHTLSGDVLTDNPRMAAFMRRQGFAAGAPALGGVQPWERRLQPSRAPAAAAPARVPAWLAAALQRLAPRRWAQASS